MNLEFLRINSRIPRINLEFPKDKFRISRDCFALLAMTKILEFLRLKIPPNPQKRKYKTNSRIPYRDPLVKLRDDIVGNSRIPS